VLADMQSSGGQLVAAITGYEAVLVEQPKNPFALNNLALLYQRRGDKRALGTALAAHESAPSSGEIADTYATILTANGRADEAVLLLEDALRKGVVLPSLRCWPRAIMARGSAGQCGSI
jgi:cellulose synthase operon protein C